LQCKAGINFSHFGEVAVKQIRRNGRENIINAILSLKCPLEGVSATRMD
jgi:hypothetical protein